MTADEEAVQELLLAFVKIRDATYIEMRDGDLAREVASAMLIKYGEPGPA